MVSKFTATVFFQNLYQKIFHLWKSVHLRIKKPLFRNVSLSRFVERSSISITSRAIAVSKWSHWDSVFWYITRGRPFDFLQGYQSDISINVIIFLYPYQLSFIFTFFRSQLTSHTPSIYFTSQRCYVEGNFYRIFITKSPYLLRRDIFISFITMNNKN